MPFWNPDTEEYRIELRALPCSTWIKDQRLYGFTEVSFAEEAERLLQSESSAGPITVRAVRVDGADVSFSMDSATTVLIRPALHLMAERLVIVCELPGKPPRSSKRSPPANPSPEVGYGLQPRSNALQRQAQ